MTFRRRLLAVFAITIVATVGVVGWIVSMRTRQAFETTDGERTNALLMQFQREFNRRGEDVVRRVEGIAASDSVARMAAEIAHGSDAAAYVTEAAPQAQTHGLDFLEFLAADGSIISSAQWPARFGYKEQLPTYSTGPAFLKREELPDGGSLGLFSVRAVRIGDQPIYVLGGQRLDRDFLASLTLPAGMRALLYRTQGNTFDSQALIGPDGVVANGDKLSALVEKVQRTGKDAAQILHWSTDPADAEGFNAIALKDDRGNLVGIFLVGSSRRGMIELQRHIRAVSLTVGGIGILAAILITMWLAHRVTKPVEQLAEAAREVAAGNWNTRVDVPRGDELGELAETFNRMTQEMVEHRERLVQAERVAAWRELARRLAHELKNPLFPLQITVENLLRARDLPSQEFEEVFRESTATLLAEISNLKNIIGRFSDFSKMPQPQLQAVQLNEVLRRVVALHEPQFNAPGKPKVAARLELAEGLPVIAADPDLLHRVFSNLVLNAMDAMPNGGTITLRTRELAEHVQAEVADTGGGLTPEECQRLFTPYYTSKQHGTGLGLAIVQSVISDHHGTITVESAPGQGATFRIELPKGEPARTAPKAEPARIG